ncbi:hypothetical protein [Acrocarpospora sp. B8E8]|uniref:hypothetical protein n=1 Tax=Acrocarpospora sp. B8E8 TaxID=3153572 RepID=UPI00325DE60B
MAADNHKTPGTTVRPEPDEVTNAQPHLQGRSIEKLLRATLIALHAEPERTLELLSPYWPPDRPRGRTRTKDRSHPSD